MMLPYRDVKTLSARSQVQLKFAKRAAKLINTHQCLIVSTDATRREMLERAATDVGWKAQACGDPAAAMAYLGRALIQLAVVDLDSLPADVFRPVAARLTANQNLLLVVCGREGDVEEEIWVRQLGAWLYLPGALESESFSLLCGEAKHIAERLWKTNAPERPIGAPLAKES